MRVVWLAFALACLSGGSASPSVSPPLSCDNGKAEAPACVSKNRKSTVNLDAGYQVGGTVIRWETNEPGAAISNSQEQIAVLSVAATGCVDRTVAVYLYLENSLESISCPFQIELSDTLAPEIQFSSFVSLTSIGDDAIEVDELQSMDTATAEDACEGQLSVLVSEVKNDEMFGSVGEHGLYSLTRTWRATDSCGNTAVKEAKIDVVDTTPPQFVVVPSVNIEAQCNDVPPPCVVEADDNSGDLPSLTPDEEVIDQDCDYTYKTLRKWVATDGVGNTADFTQTVSYRDILPPTFAGLPQPHITVECDAIPAAPTVTAVDQCDPSPSLGFEQDTSTVVEGVYSIYRTWTTSDSCGNNDTFVQTILVQDTKPPSLSLSEQDKIINCTGAIPEPCISVAHDNCDEHPSLSFSQSKEEGTCPNQYLLIHTYTVSDEAGNTNTTTRTITVQDVEGPVLRGVPAPTSAPCGPPLPPNVTANDLCEPDSITVVMTETKTGTEYNYVLTRTWTATDLCGNIAEDSQDITVSDTEGPTFPNPPRPEITSLCGNVPVAPNVTAEDDCCDVTVTYTEHTVEGTCLHQYDLVRQWTAVDCAENSNYVTQTVHVQPAELKLTGTPVSYLVKEWSDPLVIGMPESPTVTTPHCGDPEVVFSNTTIPGTCPNNYDILRTWKVEDACGQQDSFTQTISVRDTTPPDIETPDDRNSPCAAPAADWDVETSVDYEDIVIDCEPGPGSCAYAGINNCTFTVSDPCGNAKSVWALDKWSDTEAPILNCDLWSATGNYLTPPSSSDNCQDVTPTLSKEESKTECGEVKTTYKWSAVDDCGNRASPCSASEIDYDTTPPVFLNPPEDVTVYCDSDIPEPHPLFTAAPDNQEIDPETDAWTYSTCIDVAIRKWKAYDCRGNMAEVEQKITVLPQSPTMDPAPEDDTIECPSDPLRPSLLVTLRCDAGNTSVAPTVVTNGDFHYLTWEYSDSCFDLVDHQTVKVEDTTPPTVTVSDTNEPCKIKELDPVHTDTCSSVTCDFDYAGTPDFSTPNCTELVKMWTCVDESGNEATVNQTLIAHDNVDPVFTSSVIDVTEECLIGDPFPIGAYDNCDWDQKVVDYDPVQVPISQTACKSVYVRTWSVSDDCGNADQEVQTVTVQDTSPPVIKLPEGWQKHITTECLPSSAPSVSVEDCSDFTLVEDENDSYNCPHDGAIVYTFEATDECGLKSSGSQTVTFEDNEKPTLADLTLPLDEVYIAMGGNVSATDPTNVIVAAASDNCATPNVTCWYVSDGESCGQSHQWKCTVKDECNNVLGPFNVKKVTEETGTPYLTPRPGDLKLDCNDTIPPAATVTSPYGEVIYTPSVDGPEGCQTIIRTWNVTYCGVDDEHSQTIIIEDTKAPIIVTPDYNDTNCTPPMWGIYYAYDDCTDYVTVTVEEDKEPIIEDGLTIGHVYTRTFDTVDACGWSSTKKVTFTVKDDEAPVFHSDPDDVTVEAPTESPTPTVSATDNCGPNVTYNESRQDGACKWEYTMTRTWTATDPVGHTTELNQTVFSNDTLPPVFSPLPLPTDETHQWEHVYGPDGTPLVVPSLTAYDVADGDVAVNYTSVQINGSSPHHFQIHRTWYAEDECGNVAHHSQIITIIDTIVEPCNPEHVFVECDQIDSVITPAEVTKLCNESLYSDVNVTYLIDEEETIEGTCEDAYVVIRTFQVSDVAGNNALFYQTITVSDTKKPSIFVPQPHKKTTYGCGPEGVEATASDNCDNDVYLTSTTTSTAADVYVTTWEATDDCGNSEQASFEETVVDNTPPEFVFPEGPPESKNLECNLVPPPPVECTDDCSNCTVTPGYRVVESCPYLHIYTWTAKDDTNTNEASLVVTISVDDTTPPVVVAGDDMTCECDEICTPSATVSDLCGMDTGTLHKTHTVDGDVTTYLWKAYDDCGNPGTDVQKITHTPNQPPVLGPVVNTSTPCSLVYPDAPTVSDDCDEVTLTKSDHTVDTDCVEDGLLSRVIRTWTATDNYGATDTAVQTISATDSEKPVIIVSEHDEHYQCGLPTIVVEATDDCTQEVDIKEEMSPEEFDGEGYYTFTWTATDNCGRVSTKSSTILVKDDTDPDFDEDPQDENASCDEPDKPTVTFTDNCGPTTVNFTEESTAGTCVGVYTILRTWTAKDQSGNSVEVNQTVHMQWTQAPQCSSVEPDHVDCAEDLTPPTITCTDQCGSALEVTPVPDTTPNCNGFTGSIKYSAIDECGLKVSVTQPVSKTDTTPPSWDSFPEDTHSACYPEDPDNPTYSDDCGDATLSKLPQPAQNVCPHTGYKETLFIITDECGHKQNKTHNATYEDNEAPVIMPKPEHETIPCDEEPQLPELEATDSCKGTIIPTRKDDVNLPVVGDKVTSIVVRKWVATDDCGHEDIVEQTITMVDTAPPTFDGSFEDIVVECVDPPVVNATADDNCGEVTVTTSESENPACGSEKIGQTVFTYTATDEVGNFAVATRTVTVVDSSAPELLFNIDIVDMTLECGVDPPVVTCSAYDECGPNPTCTLDKQESEDKKTIVNTWTAKDECGNVVVEVQTIVILDTTPPVITIGCSGTPCPVACDGHKTPLQPTVTDTCGPVSKTSVSRNEVNCTGTYLTIWDWTATDAAGNTATASATFSYTDTVAPTITVTGENQTFSCTDSPDAPTATVTDNCDEDAELEDHIDSPGDSCEWEKKYIFWAYDDCGNLAENVTITHKFIDDVPPSLITSGQEYREIKAGESVPLPTVEAMDACNDVTITFSEKTIGNTVCEYTQIRTWVATDLCGLNDTWSQTIVVKEQDSVSLVNVPANLVVEYGEPWVSLIVPPQGVDRLGNFLPVTNHTGDCTYDEQCTSKGSCIITWKAENDCAQATAPTTITFVDTTPPTYVCPPVDKSLPCDENPQAQEAKVATDSSWEGTKIVSVSTNKITGSCEQEYKLVRHYHVSDCAGNSKEYLQTITVSDEGAPSLSRKPADESAECSCDSLPPIPTLQAVDDCGDVTLVSSETRVNGSSADAYLLIRTWGATDTCGNADGHTQTVSVVDIKAPVIEGVGADLALSCEEVMPANAVLAFDDCDESVEVVPEENTVPGSCVNEYSIARTWTATDRSGNSASESQTIVVDDKVAPILMNPMPQTCLTPPDKQFRVFSLADLFDVYDNCDDAADVSIDLKSCNSTEPSVGEANQAFPSDCALSQSEGELHIRAERNADYASGPMRTYVIYATITDTCGNALAVQHTVNVPSPDMAVGCVAGTIGTQ